MKIDTPKWIWEHEAYPRFPYNPKAIARKLRRVQYLRGELAGIFTFADSRDRDQITIASLTDEILSTSQIEGEYLRRESVRDSVARAINDDFISAEDMSTRHTDNLVELMLDSCHNDQPLSIERLHGWHSALFADSGGYAGIKKIRVAAFRDYDEMKVVERSFGRGGDIVKYIAPPHRRMREDIDALIAYCNTADEPPCVKSALAHLWFVSIHPYDDGNGRISRAIADYVLSRDTQEAHKIFSTSAVIYARRNAYYELLDHTTNLHKNRHYDFTAWIEWNLDILIEALETSRKRIAFVIHKTRFWDRHREAGLSPEHIRFLDAFMGRLSDGGENAFSNADYRAVTDTIPMTANRHIKRMLEHGIIRQIDGTRGRGVRYALVWG